MNEEKQAKFEGWANVEIMGHQSAAGYVTTEAFGNVVMFRIVTPEVPPTETIIDKDIWFDGQRVYAGSRIRISRKRAECLVGVPSVYRLTPIPEESVLQYSPLETEVVEKAERKTISTPQSDPFEFVKELGVKVPEMYSYPEEE